ncbi:uncharacterized protein AMSG_11910 [Thecamonas trahens ATCC 50062]|uniref:CRC domain-containing protein n=1 Tax=Thecamonas trahens ATCC 50062 TaxID=461836 RepID=A0A0L0DCJ0_THETB|nr:hypothetical protein AMSG_11910 [Thecamonas trahens ATCC 50062]KNC50052.1 hypothetical protein AMSG_11910 [Thecamonas trahens ATCC 50062]|eukprot:XP_013757303.1 hypothetical protein AMSG_11910 [Thecamonas trahens ATCC 50062]
MGRRATRSGSQSSTTAASTTTASTASTAATSSSSPHPPATPPSATKSVSKSASKSAAAKSAKSAKSAKAAKSAKSAKSATPKSAAGKRAKRPRDRVGTGRCRCAKSKCLQLYCECFSSSRMCSDECECRNCCNTEAEDHAPLLANARRLVRRRNPTAFGASPTSGGGAAAETPSGASMTPPSRKRGRSTAPTSASPASKCLKLYCDCFAAGVYCSSCACVNCQNTREHEDARAKAVQIVLERDPNAFRPKFVPTSVSTSAGKHSSGLGSGRRRPSKIARLLVPSSPSPAPEDGSDTLAAIQPFARGCNCIRSRCLKRYCDCYQAESFCSSACGCIDCGNTPANAQEDVANFMKEQNPDTVLRQLREDYSKYKFMESKLMQNRSMLKTKIPDIKNCIDMVAYLQKARDEGTTVETQYPLSDNVYANAAIENPQTVCLFLGAGVLMEYELDEAAELLARNLETAQNSLDSLQNDIGFLKDQITITEVNTARVYNFDVIRRRKAAADGTTLEENVQ